jgi:heptosyltransferase-3
MTRAGRTGAKRILVVATRQIGDVLLTTPLVRAARARWPQARIEVLGQAGTLGMLRGNPDIDETIEAPVRLGGTSALKLFGRLWRRYDLALITDVGDRAHLMGWIASRNRSGIIPPKGGSNWWKRALLDHVVVAVGDRGEVHAAVEKVALLSPWVDIERIPLRVVPPEATALPAAVQSQLGASAIVVHAPSMWAYKQWPPAHFKVLVQGLLAAGHQVVLTGSASGRDRECIAPLLGLDQAPRLLDLSGRLDFNQLVTLLRGAALYIGPDTSVSHLAAAAGVPVLAIFGPTNPMRWAPWPAQAPAGTFFARVEREQTVGNVTILQSNLGCVPCGRAGCEDHRQSRSDCLIDIEPQRVLARAMTLLAGGPQRGV